jgi:hypothetical protein
MGYWGEAQMLPCPFCGQKTERARLQMVFGGGGDFMSALMGMAAQNDTSQGGKHIEQTCDHCGKTFESRLAPDALAIHHGKSFHQWRPGPAYTFVINSAPNDELASAKAPLKTQPVTLPKPHITINNSPKLNTTTIQPIENKISDNKTRYCLVFTGKIANNRNIEEVKRNLAAQFKKDITSIERYFSGQHIVIKKDVDYQTAIKYKNAYEKIGLIIDIEEITTTALVETSNEPSAEQGGALNVQNKTTVQLVKPVEDNNPTNIGMSEHDDTPKKILSTSNRELDVLSILKKYHSKLAHPNISMAPDISQKALNNVMVRYAYSYNKKNENALVLIDIIDSAGARVGILLTDKALYAYGFGTKPCNFCFKDISSINLIEGIKNNFIINRKYQIAIPSSLIEQIKFFIILCDEIKQYVISHPLSSSKKNQHEIVQIGNSAKEEANITTNPDPITADIVYFECTRPSGDGKCSDDSCPCGYPGEDIALGCGYLYISKELVEMRRDALSIAELHVKFQKIQLQMGAAMIMSTSGVFMPILMCEQGAKKRGIDLSVAAADAKHWWKIGLAPLRPTPMIKGN